MCDPFSIGYFGCIITTQYTFVYAYKNGYFHGYFHCDNVFV